eukprot:scaffold5732_cov116-Isochrysis_galbana.AAC.1
MCLLPKSVHPEQKNLAGPEETVRNRCNTSSSVVAATPRPSGLAANSKTPVQMCASGLLVAATARPPGVAANSGTPVQRCECEARPCMHTRAPCRWRPARGRSWPWSPWRPCAQRRDWPRPQSPPTCEAA